jgi:hypothetical protein
MFGTMWKQTTSRVPRWPVLVVLLVLALAVTACAPGANPEIGTPSEAGTVAGFWLGLWHGIIAPVTFIISLFTDSVNFYEVHNSGNWYDFGFVLGAGILFGGGGAGSRRRAR